MSKSIETLQTALAEVRAQRSQFSPKVFDTIITALLEKLQHDRAETDSKNHSAKTDEIRLVTVMFVDVVESTRLTQQMESSDWKDLISHAHKLMVATILEFEGSVGQFLGDGMLCYFGAQDSRRDDALRAVDCALMIQKHMEAYSEEAMRHYKMKTGFAIRISLSTGRVVVGMIGSDDKQELLALGPATNLASRLQSFAKPQTIVIDPQTQRRVRSHFKLNPHEPVKVKGFEEMIAYHTVLGKIENPSVDFTNNKISGRTIPFVGRETERTQIADMWWQAQVDNQFKVVSILGEVGIGKSRLLQDILEIINEQPVTLIRMFADYERRDMSHNLLRNLLITHCNLTDDTPPDVAKKRITDYVIQTWDNPDAEAAGNVLGLLYTDNSSDEAQAEEIRRNGHLRQRMIFMWISRWFMGMARSSSLLIVVDNLQWIDSLSVELLEYLAIELRQESGMIIGAGRSDMRVNNSGYMYRVPNHVAVVLPPLEKSDTIALIQQVLHDVKRLSQSIIESIADRSNGNPLFLREFLSILFDNQVIAKKNESFTFNLVKYYTTLSELPTGLTGVLQARLDELPAQARLIVQASATVGQRFWSGMIDEMIGDDTDNFLDELVQRGIIYQNSESSFENEREFQFRHSLFQEVAYGMLPRAQRETYHSVVTRWMVTRMAGKPEYFPMLADQFAKSDQYEASLFTYLEAVQNRLERGLLDETLALVESGLAQAPHVPREVALPVTSQLWTIRAQAYNALNRYSEASAAAEAALKLLDELPMNQLVNIRITAARLLGTAYRSMGRYQEAFEALTNAHELTPESDGVFLEQVLGAFASLSMYRGQLNESFAYQERAYSYAQKTNSINALSGNLTQLGLIALQQGKPSDALDYFEPVLKHNVDRKNIHYQILDLRNIGATYLSVFAYEEAIVTIEGAQELEGYIHHKDALLQAYRALALIEVGRIEEGITEMQDALSRGHKDTYYNLQTQLIQIEAWVKLKRYDEAFDKVRDFLETTRNQNQILYGRGLLMQGQLYQISDPSRAEGLLEQALEHELKNAGLYVWVCHYALAQATADAALRHQRLNQAFQVLTTIGESLSSRSDLQASFTGSTIFRHIEQMIEPV
jgi:class 3 adenylate cyclase/tetratricopeptide (TPR) repeat protein